MERDTVRVPNAYSRDLVGREVKVKVKVKVRKRNRGVEGPLPLPTVS